MEACSKTIRDQVRCAKEELRDRDETREEYQLQLACVVEQGIEHVPRDVLKIVLAKKFKMKDGMDVDTAAAGGGGAAVGGGVSAARDTGQKGAKKRQKRKRTFSTGNGEPAASVARSVKQKAEQELPSHPVVATMTYRQQMIHLGVSG